MKIVNDQRVVDFVAERCGATQVPQCYPIGLEDDNGCLIAGAVYERGNGFNVYMHGAIDTLVTRAYIRALFDYPFNKLGVQRLTVMPPSSNVKACQWDERIGFVEEGRLKQAAHDGSDIVVYVMWKEGCRWI